MSARSASATREALGRLADSGSDLSKPMEIDFFVAVPSRAAGAIVASRARENGFLATVECDDQDDDWTCCCSRVVVPAFETIVSIERQLNEMSVDVGGRCDGFGSYGNSGGA